MPNYKPYAPLVTIGGRSISVPLEELVVLYMDHNLGTTAQSLKDTATNADYVVPGSKTLKVIGMRFYVQGVANITIYQGDTADATTLGKVIYITPNLGGMYDFLGNIQFGSLKYITLQESAGTLLTSMLIGYLD